MIPTTVEEEVIRDDFEIIEEVDLPSKTYKMLLGSNRVRGYVDGQDAMVQAIYKRLNTERGEYEIYSDYPYGTELWSLIGMPLTFVVPEVERRIKESLLEDERIVNVYNFTFDTTKKDVVGVKFYAATIFGEVEITYEVTIQ